MPDWCCMLTMLHELKFYTALAQLTRCNSHEATTSSINTECILGLIGRMALPHHDISELGLAGVFCARACVQGLQAVSAKVHLEKTLTTQEFLAAGTEQGA